MEVIKLNLFKIFPLRLDIGFHKRIKTAAVKDDKTIENFIKEAIKEKLEKEG